MKKLVIVLILGIIGWQAYGRFQRPLVAPLVSPADVSQQSSSIRVSYSCDGRTYCSQMTSCDEATWFLKHCPGTKMDGNNDGIPCEKQWCK